MAIVKLSAPVVRLDNYAYTIAELLDAGRITLQAYQEYKRDGTKRQAYRAILPDGRFWEISRVAYQSRTGQAVTIERKPKKQAWIW